MTQICSADRCLAIALLFSLWWPVGGQGETVAPLVIAHRGDSAKLPENTAIAIRSAVAVKADLIEFDVRETADGKLVLFHDADLKRFDGTKTPFESLGFQQARQLDVGTWFDREGKRFSDERPPTLAEAIRLCVDGESRALVERKSGPASAYVEIIRAMEVEDQVVVQAFDWKFLEDFRRLAPEIPIGALGSKEIDSDRLRQLKSLAPKWVGWNQKYLAASDIERFHDLGFRVAVWTVNDLARLRRFAGWGVDAVITDRPAEARETLKGGATADQP